jgi:LysR family transcriptional regulator, regulator for bpeEF and oprC
MSLDRIKAIEVFTVVAEVGSFTAAARALGLPNASVSRLVQMLEAHLAVKLLHRTTRQVKLTEDGERVRQRAVLLLQDLAELEGATGSATQVPAGRLRVDVPASMGRHVIAPALPGFFERFPGIALELGSSDRPVDLVAEGVDCVIRGGNVFDESLVASPLPALAVVTCASPEYLARHGTPLIPDDLLRHRFVNFFSPKSGRVFPLDFAQGQSVTSLERPHWVATNDADTMVAAALAGLGFIQVPCNAPVRALLARGKLRRVLSGWTPEALTMNVLYARNRHLSARVRVFIDWVRGVFEREAAAAALAARTATE